MAETLNAADVLGNTFQTLDSSGGGANKLPRADARYILELDKAQIRPSTNPQTKGAPIFVADFIVIETGHPDVTVGAKKSWTQNLNQKFDDKEYGKENLKQFVAALMGLSPGTPEANAINNAHVQAVLDGEWKGEWVQCDTVPKTSKSNNDWTLHVFSPAPEAPQAAQ